MEINGNKNSQKLAKDFVCVNCDYKCSRKNDYIKHLSTRKHELEINGNKNSQKLIKDVDAPTEISKQKKQYECACEKKYKSYSGLWKHKQRCKVFLENEIDKDADMIWTLVKQNQEFKDMMMEQQKFMMEMAQKSNSTIQNITNNNIMQNTQNNQFNLQFFLNETCKNAMNINQFIDSIQIQLEDLDYTGKHGFVKGISNVIVRELKALDQTVRPLHCSDEKREVIYIKTNDVWEKDIDYAGVTRFTKHLAHKKFLKIKEWMDEYPSCMAHDDKKNDDYLNILGQITSGFTQLSGFDAHESMKKIIKTIVKQVIIQKNVVN